MLSLQDNCFDAKSEYTGLLFDERSIFKFEVGLPLRFIRIPNQPPTSWPQNDRADLY